MLYIYVTYWSEVWIIDKDSEGKLQDGNGVPAKKCDFNKIRQNNEGDYSEQSKRKLQEYGYAL